MESVEQFELMSRKLSVLTTCGFLEGTPSSLNKQTSLQSRRMRTVMEKLLKISCFFFVKCISEIVQKLFLDTVLSNWMVDLKIIILLAEWKTM